MAAASGMAAEQRSLDTIAANLANAEVPGFKGSEATFTELASRLGTTSAGTRLMLQQGKILKSAGPLDLAIDGAGFFVVRDAHGAVAYTRAGDFSRQADGTVRNGRGAVLENVRIPADATHVAVQRDGRVLIDDALHKGVEVGRVPLARFAAPEYLAAGSDGLFSATAASGAAIGFEPGTGNNAVVLGSSLEQSNVTVIEAMMQIIAAQRAFEANSKGVQAADEMQRIANNILRANG